MCPIPSRKALIRHFRGGTFVLLARGRQTRPDLWRAIAPLHQRRWRKIMIRPVSTSYSLTARMGVPPYEAFSPSPVPLFNRVPHLRIVHPLINLPTNLAV